MHSAAHSSDDDPQPASTSMLCDINGLWETTSFRRHKNPTLHNAARLEKAQAKAQGKSSNSSCSFQSMSATDPLPLVPHQESHFYYRSLPYCQSLASIPSSTTSSNQYCLSRRSRIHSYITFANTIMVRRLRTPRRISARTRD